MVVAMYQLLLEFTLKKTSVQLVVTKLACVWRGLIRQIVRLPLALSSVGNQRRPARQKDG